MGDSLTLGWDKELWKERFEPLAAANFGIGGDGTPQLLWRLENGGFDGLRLKVVVPTIGINNVWPGYSAKDTAKGIRVFVGKLREKMPDARIVICGVLPIFDQTDSIRDYIKTVNADVADLNNGKTIRFIDFGTKLLNADGSRKEGY